MTKIYSLSLLALLSLSVGCGGGATGSVAATSDAVAAAANTVLTCYNNTLGAVSLTFTIPTAAQISAACSSDDIAKAANSLACAIDAKPSFCQLTAAWDATPAGSRAEEVATAAIIQLGNKCREDVSPNCARLFL